MFPDSPLWVAPLKDYPFLCNITFSLTHIHTIFLGTPSAMHLKHAYTVLVSSLNILVCVYRQQQTHLYQPECFSPTCSHDIIQVQAYICPDTPQLFPCILYIFCCHSASRDRSEAARNIENPRRFPPAQFSGTEKPDRVAPYHGIHRLQRRVRNSYLPTWRLKSA